MCWKLFSLEWQCHIQKVWLTRTHRLSWQLYLRSTCEVPWHFAIFKVLRDEHSNREPIRKRFFSVKMFYNFSSSSREVLNLGKFADNQTSFRELLPSFIAASVLWSRRAPWWTVLQHHHRPTVGKISLPIWQEAYSNNGYLSKRQHWKSQQTSILCLVFADCQCPSKAFLSFQPLFCFICLIEPR